jgi:ribonuclease HI
MTIYQAWLARNEAIDNDKIEDPTLIAKRALHLLEEWHSVHGLKQAKTPTPKERWLPPEQGWTKVNADGAFVKFAGNGGGGVVVRDHDGRFLAGSSHFSPSLLDPEQAELLACQKALELMEKLKLKKVIVELDSEVVVSKLKSVEVDRSVHGILVEEIKRALRDIDDHVVKWVRLGKCGSSQSGKGRLRFRFKQSMVSVST